MDQIFLIDKPAGWTSFDVVARIRGEIRKKLNEKSNPNSQKLIANSCPTRIRVGHAGTLDPFATGLLIVLVGEATKKQEKFMKLDKEYEATLCLGAKSTTGDPEGIISEVKAERGEIEVGEISKVLTGFIGEISQIPPIYSAIKVDGQRAYTLARAGKEVVLNPRTVTIYQIIILDYKWPELKILVRCSSGTYLRTLAEDIGKELKTGAYLTDLRRTKIGDYSISDAMTINEATDNITPLNS